MGNVPDLKISLKVDKKSHKESHSGQRLTDFELVTGKEGELSCTLEDFSKDNLKLVVYGAHEAVTSGSVTNEAFAEGVVVGSLRLLAKSVRLKCGHHRQFWHAQNARHCTVQSTCEPRGGRVLDITTDGPYVQPFKAAYTKGAAVRTAMFKTAQPELWLRFDGINTADQNKRVIVDLYKVSIDRPGDLSLIGDDLQKFELSGMVLADTSKEPDGELGQFGRIARP